MSILKKRGGGKLNHKVFLALNLNLIHVFTPKGKRPLKINSSTLFIKYSGSELMLPYS